MFIQNQDQKDSPAKVAGRNDTGPANFQAIFGRLVDVNFRPLVMQHVALA